MQDFKESGLNNGELFLTCVGILDIFTGKVKVTKLNKAMKVEKDIYNKCLSFLSEEKFEKINIEMPKMDYLEVAEQISMATDAAWLSERLAGIEDVEIASSLGLVVGKAIEYLRIQMPKLPISLSSRKVRASDLEVSRFNRVFRTINNPITVLDDMLSGCLSRMQVKTLMEVYPNLYEIIVTQFNMAAINITMKDKNFQVSYPKMKQISVLMLSSTVSESLSEVLQGNFVKEDQKEGGGGPSLGGNTLKSELLTSTQKTEFKNK